MDNTNAATATTTTTTVNVWRKPKHPALVTNKTTPCNNITIIVGITIHFWWATAVGLMDNGLDWFFLIPEGQRPKPATPLHAMLFCPVQFSCTQPLVVRFSLWCRLSRVFVVFQLMDNRKIYFLKVEILPTGNISCCNWIATFFQCSNTVRWVIGRASGL